MRLSQLLPSFVILLYFSNAFACGTAGSLQDRINDCSVKNANKKIDGFTLVTVDKDGFEFWQDNQSKLVWTQTINSKGKDTFKSSDLSGLCKFPFRIPTINDYKFSKTQIKKLIGDKPERLWAKRDNASQEPKIYGKAAENTSAFPIAHYFDSTSQEVKNSTDNQYNLRCVGNLDTFVLIEGSEK